MKNLTEMAGLTNDSGIYKPLRDTEIRRSELLVSKVIDVLENDYLNPFSINLDCEELFNLSSGLQYQDDPEALLNIWDKGKDLYDQFLRERIHSREKAFTDALPRNKPTLFSSTSKKVKSASTSSEVVKANRNILGKLLSLSARFEEPIDFSRALQYPLYPVPLSLSFPDGTKRQTQKSKLLEVFIDQKSAHNK